MKSILSLFALLVVISLISPDGFVAVFGAIIGSFINLVCLIGTVLFIVFLYNIRRFLESTNDFANSVVRILIKVGAIIFAVTLLVSSFLFMIRHQTALGIILLVADALICWIYLPLLFMW